MEDRETGAEASAAGTFREFVSSFGTEKPAAGRKHDRMTRAKPPNGVDESGQNRGKPKKRRKRKRGRKVYARDPASQQPAVNGTAVGTPAPAKRAEPAARSKGAPLPARAGVASGVAKPAIIRRPAGAELPLFAAQDCRACHRTSVNLVGPAYAAIAARYEPTDANVGLLVSRIIGGSEGVWGETPMTPHPMLVPATAREMVAEILGLAP